MIGTASNASKCPFLRRNIFRHINVQKNISIKYNNDQALPKSRFTYFKNCKKENVFAVDFEDKIYAKRKNEIANLSVEANDGHIPYIKYTQEEDEVWSIC